MDKKTITVLGSTGSVGRQALDTARAENLPVKALAAGSDYITLEKQAREFMPDFCVLDDAKAAQKLKISLADTNIKVLAGFDGIKYIINECGSDVIINSITGAAGLLPTLEAVRTGSRLALANKESLVMAGGVIMDLAKSCGAELIPVDSEHSAIFQCLQGRAKNDIKRILLTASGGPFYGYKPSELKKITVEAALAHPTWKMGKKITVDSATLMNKGFEVIEAARLFSVEAGKIKVLIHRESIIHSMVEYFDNSIAAQMSVPDMRLCVQYAINYPERRNAVIEQLDLVKVGRLSFGEPDTETFPLLAAAFGCLKEGGAMPAILNAANEAAVDAFLNRRIGFADIPPVVLETLGHFSGKASIGAGNVSDRCNCIDEIFNYDRLARSYAANMISRYSVD
jgi:1-deoxy-D-xylulose-5-phosphate reductoisomerase